MCKVVKHKIFNGSEKDILREGIIIIIVNSNRICYKT